ncbi:uncharacterized protein LOC126778153 [Nymphalis io]|uniref:uncharacterized protein LOC126778153 n=1 Tax=Inachis io TaxID=171585 RepID=UPI0021678B14|nr:uncharacterized protein LOC126778153 [Nymphalis io]
MDKYYKNFILCGEANFYCILCQESFVIKLHVEKHLRWEKHRTNIKKQEYAPKFKKDFIYKFADEYYYCEICNIVTQNAVDHIKGSNHEEIKKSDKNKLRASNVDLDEDGSIKVQNRVITKLQWHGIADNLCLTCNETVEKLLAHINSFNHMIRLIQSETTIKDDQLYRQLGENNFYCFTCAKVLDSKSLETHLADNHNRNENENNSKKISQKNIKKKLNPSLDTNIHKEPFETQLLKKIEDKYFSFEIENKATCLKCQEIVELTYDAIYQHKKSHQSPEEIIAADLFWLRRDRGKERAELATYGRANFIKLNEGGRQGYCSLCNKWLSAHIYTAKQHVEGAHHRGHLELKGLIKEQKHEKPNINSVPYRTFLSVMYGPFEIDELSYVVINNGIGLTTFSYTLMCLIDDIKMLMKCFCCDLTIDMSEIKEHVKSKEHRKILFECKVLPIVLEGYEEFVRQIHPGLYHCGYCNKTFPFWENMGKHLESLPHAVQRRKLKLITYICGKLYLDPSFSLADMIEYKQLKKYFH